MPDPSGDDRQTVEQLLRVSGLTPTPADLDVLVRSYAGVRRLAALLYTVPGVRYAEPAIGFDPREDAR